MNDIDHPSDASSEPELTADQASLEKTYAAAQTARRILEERKAEEVEIVDVTGKTSLVDFFVIATATSGIHIKSLTDAVLEGLEKERGLVPDGVEGVESENWILLDYNDFVVHLMLAEQRDYYDLEHLWSGINASRRK